VRREVVGGAAGRRRQEDPVADELGEPDLAVATRIAIFAAWRVSRRSATSLKAIAATVWPPTVSASMRNGFRVTACALASRGARVCSPDGVKR
jgi:hypothetical protein